MRQKTQFEETPQASEPDSDMTEMFKWSDPEFKTSVFNVGNALGAEVNSIHEQAGNAHREMEILRTN